MLFNTWEYWIFFIVVLAGFQLAGGRWKTMVLLVASYVFYMWWNPRYSLLILATTGINYWAGRQIGHGALKKKRVFLVLSVGVSLGLLGFFKYYNFFVDAVTLPMGLSATSLRLDILLPVGISFYTFQSLSYTIDVYRGRLEPVDDFFDFALFVAFFPQLVAGPIVRAKDFFPQLYNRDAGDGERIQKGIYLVLIGLVKKMVFADHFALVVDAYFGNLAGNPGTVQAWVAVLAFSMQIFFDFSGYTDIARGCAKILGFDFPVNFRRPYLATSLTDFWRRWHISLSTWLRDYLYISIGGNRHGTINMYRNIMITMLLGGLWHGANWNFLIWGGYHGLLLIITRMAQGVFRRAGWDRFLSGPFFTPVKIGFTFFLVMIGWVFFRADQLSDSIIVLNRMFVMQPGGEPVLETGMLFLTAIAIVLAILEEKYQLLEKTFSAAAWIKASAYAASFFIIEIFSVTGEKIPFVYFQF